MDAQPLMTFPAVWLDKHQKWRAAQEAPATDDLEESQRDG